MSTVIEDLRTSDGLFPDDIVDILIGADPSKVKVYSHLRRMVVPHSRHVRGIKFLKHMLTYAKTGRESECGLLYGLPGVGKSTIISEFCGEFARPLETRRGTLRPVLRIETPSQPNIGNLYRALLKSLGVSEDSGKVPDMKNIFLAQIKQQSVRLVIFDEFTHVVEDRTEKFTNNLSREIKEFINKDLFNVVFAGTTQLTHVYDLYSQIRRRAESEQNVKPFDWGDDGDHEEWFDILEVTNANLPIRSQIALNKPAMAELLHRSCDGIMSGLFKLLVAASLAAADEEDDPELRLIRPGHFWEGFESLRRLLENGKGDKLNPFKKPKTRKIKPVVYFKPEEDRTNLSSRRKGKEVQDDETFTGR